MENFVKNEIKIARKIAGGDEGALELFYDRYANHLFAFIFHTLQGSQKDAEDIWQETLSTAILNIGEYQGKSKLFTWMCAIARHKIADFFRKNGLKQVKLSEEISHRISMDMQKGLLPETIIENRLVCSQVAIVMGRMPDKYSAVLVRRYYEGCTVQEIASLMGLTYKAAESLLSRARRMFRKEFMKIEGEEQ